MALSTDSAASTTTWSRLSGSAQPSSSKACLATSHCRRQRNGRVRDAGGLQRVDGATGGAAREALERQVRSLANPASTPPLSQFAGRRLCFYKYESKPGSDRVAPGDDFDA